MSRAVNVPLSLVAGFLLFGEVPEITGLIGSLIVVIGTSIVAVGGDQNCDGEPIDDVVSYPKPRTETEESLEECLWPEDHLPIILDSCTTIDLPLCEVP